VDQVEERSSEQGFDFNLCSIFAPDSKWEVTSSSKNFGIGREEET